MAEVRLQKFGMEVATLSYIMRFVFYNTAQQQCKKKKKLTKDETVVGKSRP